MVGILDRIGHRRKDRGEIAERLCVAVEANTHSVATNIWVNFESELHYDETGAYADGDGNFLICGLPPGIGFVMAEPTGEILTAQRILKLYSWKKGRLHHPAPSR